jgi:hypothetical protein
MSTDEHTRQRAAVYDRLYERHQRRVLGPGVEADFADTVHFIVYAAAAGIVGNLASDVVKAVVRRVFSNPKLFARYFPDEGYRPDPTDVVLDDDYESERRQLHTQPAAPQGDERFHAEVEEILRMFVRGWPG